MNKIKNLWNKFKQVKHYQIYLVLVIGLFACALYFSFLSKPTNDNQSNISTQTPTDAEEYVRSIENKLCSVISNISGVGQVDVVVTLASGFSYVYATDLETKTTSSGSTQTTISTEETLLVGDKPVVVKEIFPEIKGVVVVAKGAENIGVKLNILSAVETALEIDAKDITILA